MNRKRVIIALVSLCIVLCFVGQWFYFGIYGHRGTAASIENLARVYQTGDANLAAFYTDSFLHRLHFTAPIRWHRAVWRPSVTITSQVDVAAFRRDMSPEAFVDLHPEWVSRGVSTVYNFKSLYRLKDDWIVENRGSLDVSSGAFEMRSQTFYSKVDDHWWHQLTNGGRVDFAFDVKTP